MAPTDDDQQNERESRVAEMIKGYQRDHPTDPTGQQDDRPDNRDSPHPGRHASGSRGRTPKGRAAGRLQRTR